MPSWTPDAAIIATGLAVGAALVFYVVDAARQMTRRGDDR